MSNSFIISLKAEIDFELCRIDECVQLIKRINAMVEEFGYHSNEDACKKKARVRELTAGIKTSLTRVRKIQSVL